MVFFHSESSSIELNDETKQVNARQVLNRHSKLLDLIGELRQVEAKLNPRLPERNEESWCKFFAWIDSELTSEEQKKLSTKVGVARQTSISQPGCDEFSLVAKVPFKEHDSIFAIDRRIMMSTETAENDVSLYEFIRKDSIASSMKNVVLVLHLLNEFSKGTMSQWWPYLSILPARVLPVFELTKEKLQLLIPSAHLFEALKMIRAISRQYAYFVKRFESVNLPVCKDFTYKYYSWGVSIVCSRNNEIPPINRKASRGGITHALIPVLDMCNHDRFSNQALFEASQTKLFASKDLAIGDEVTINYGARLSGDFYIHNGFVPEEIVFDAVPLTIVLDPQEAHYQVRAKLLKTLNMHTFGKFKLTRNNFENRHKRDPHLTMFLIVYLMNENDLDYISKSDNIVGIADEIYDYVQYKRSAMDSNQIDAQNMNGHRVAQDAIKPNEDKLLALETMKERLAIAVKNYLSRRCSIGLALIDRILNDEKCQIDLNTSQLLKHERSIYESHIINCKAD